MMLNGQYLSRGEVRKLLAKEKIPGSDKEDIEGILSGKCPECCRRINVKTASGNMYNILLDDSSGKIPPKIIQLTDEQYNTGAFLAKN